MGFNGRDPHAAVTDGDRQAFDDFLGSALPGVQKMMRELRERDPERADKKLREALPRIGWLMDLRERDRELYDLRIQDIGLGREALEAVRGVARFDRDQPGRESSEERSKLAAAAESVLRAQYDVRGQIMAREVDLIENSAARRRAELDRRGNDKESAVRATFDKLMARAAEWMKHPRERRDGQNGS